METMSNKGRRDPVKKNMDVLHKPKTFRDRKKEYARNKKYEGIEHEHPVHQPYHRAEKYKDMYENEPAEDEEDLDEDEEGEWYQEEWDEEHWSVSTGLEQPGSDNKTD